MLNINVNDIIKSRNAETDEQGNMLYEKINEIHSNNPNDTIMIDLSEVDLFTSAFINNAIGKLFSIYKIEQISSFLKFTGLKTEDDFKTLRLAIANAINKFTQLTS